MYNICFLNCPLTPLYLLSINDTTLTLPYTSKKDKNFTSFRIVCSAGSSSSLIHRHTEDILLSTYFVSLLSKTCNKSQSRRCAIDTESLSAVLLLGRRANYAACKKLPFSSSVHTYFSSSHGSMTSCSLSVQKLHK